MREVFEYLKNCETFYLATMDGDQPRVRPFGALAIFEDKLYIQTDNVKKVFKQMEKNPKIEISGMGKDGSWIRLTTTAIQDESLAARQHMLDENPGLKGIYAADDGICEVLYLTNSTATIDSFDAEPKIINF